MKALIEKGADVNTQNKVCTCMYGNLLHQSHACSEHVVAYEHSCFRTYMYMYMCMMVDTGMRHLCEIDDDIL